MQRKSGELREGLRRRRLFQGDDSSGGKVRGLTMFSKPNGYLLSYCLLFQQPEDGVIREPSDDAFKSQQRSPGDHQAGEPSHRQDLDAQLKSLLVKMQVMRL